MRIISTKDEINAGFESEFQADEFIKEYKNKGYFLCYKLKHYNGEIEVKMKKIKGA